MDCRIFVIYAMSLVVAVAAVGDWKIGRGTFYGNEYWLWDIHQGSCGYSYLCPEEGTGWDITALPDTHPAYAGSCGRCYEVKCAPVDFSDNYGEKLSRSGVCYDTEASVIVTTTDTCPCYYPTNLYSNARWCCGDMDHLDLSVWAFEKLAEKRWGVIGLNYREVPCDHQPYKVASEPAAPFDPTPVIEGTVCPKGQFPLKENWDLIHMMYKKRLEAVGLTPFQSAGEYEERVQARLSGAYPKKRDVEQYIFGDEYAEGWSMFTKGVQYREADITGIDHTNAMCGTWSTNSALGFSGPYGSLSGKGAIEFWVYTRDWGIPRLDIGFGGNGGMCESIRLTDLYTAGEQDGYTKFVVNLNTFASEGDLDMRMLNSIGTRFHGCGGLSADSFNFVTIQNNMHFEQTVCLDEIKFVSP
eukprot:TRINITY_DN66_c1_g1_i2.p1 TRINITY_DN66_c1_g1~~TRINITY_DN66_c1_g1_i2.p1  ORF type:complete len:413 (+),score=49.36 TRINITY_DN66_c1_g1_i2:196-1434(+)